MRQLQRGLQADGEGNRLGSGTQAVLLKPAPQPRFEPGAVAQEQRPDACWTVEFVGGKREGGDAQLAKIHRDSADGLDGIGVQGHSCGVHRSAISRMGCSTPVSLFPSMTLTSRVSGDRSSGKRSSCTTPSRDTGRYRTSKPSRWSCFAGSAMLGCSMAEMMIRPGG